MKLTCPEDSCQSQTFTKDGHYFRKNDSKYIQRYKCTICGKRTSTARLSPCFRQNKRTANSMIEALLCSKVSQRRIAKILNIDKKTVHRKIIFLGIRAEEFNRSFREKFNESKIKKLQFDDLITKEKTKLLPLTVTGIVEPESRRILALEAGAIPAFGHLSKLSKKKYGWRKSEHKDSLKRAFEKIKSIVHDEAEIRSDEHKLYPDFIRSYFPISNYKRYSSIKSCIAGQGELKKSNRDPLYSINHTFAMMRDNINRLVRKSWCVTQDIQMLQHHLEIYIKFHNTKLV